MSDELDVIDSNLSWHFQVSVSLCLRAAVEVAFRIAVSPSEIRIGYLSNIVISVIINPSCTVDSAP
jgi:hypothetical protein